MDAQDKMTELERQRRRERIQDEIEAIRRMVHFRNRDLRNDPMFKNNGRVEHRP